MGTIINNFDIRFLLKENKITYLAIGIIAGLLLTYAYTKWKEKKE